MKKVKRKKEEFRDVKSSKSDLYLFILLVFFISIIGGVYFYYKQVINKPIPSLNSFSPVSQAYAQSDIGNKETDALISKSRLTLSKKKNLIL